MQPSTAQTFTPGRVVALTLIALVVAGLAYLRFGPADRPVRVPAGAHAGQLNLKPCSYETETGRVAADCGTLVVPENRHDPDSRLIALPVIRIRARSAHPRTAVFRLQGGPGITNMQFGGAGRLAATRDVVLVGYRGVDGSVRLDCPEVDSAMAHASDLLDRQAVNAYANGYRSCAKRLQAGGVDLGGYSLLERVDDLEAARRALGYHRIDLVSESEGTRTAMIYAWRYPKRVERSVMVGVNPPGNFVWHPGTTDELVQRYARLCAHDTSCSSRTNDLAATLASTAIPRRWWFLPIKKSNVRIATFFGLMNTTSTAAGPISAPRTIDAWLSAAHGDPSGLWLQSLLAQLVFPTAQVKGDVASIGRLDAADARAYFAGRRGRGSILGDTATAFLWDEGRLARAWPANPDDGTYTRVRTSRVPTLLVSGNLDVATPPQNATRELLPYLPNGRQVVLTDLGHSDDFWSYEPAAGTHLIDTYLSTGRVDASRFTHHALDFTPGVTQTEIAKIALAAMLSLTAIAMLALVLLPLRVHRRGSLGRKSAVFVRSLAIVVIGVGGWLAGVLVALTTMPTVPVDSDLLAALSIGLPVGLSVYWAWVRRERTRAERAIGVAGALAGALVGGWLGCHAVSGPFAAMTAVAGAAAGGNLTLLVLDMVRNPGAAPTREPGGARAAPTTPMGEAC